MTVRPIIFSGPMVRALLEGKKTQTRRIIRGVGRDNCMTVKKPTKTKAGTVTHVLDAGEHGLLPYAPGDLLYVRENYHFRSCFDDQKPSEVHPSESVSCSADLPIGISVLIGKCRPSIHMPRWASRLTLEVTGVKVERLQDISHVDAIAEGIMRAPQASAGMVRFCLEGWDWKDWKTSARDAYHSLWDSLNEKRGFGWAVNPWVVAVTFKVHHSNVDQMKRAA